jgi:hypothetical protein
LRRRGVLLLVGALFVGACDGLFEQPVIVDSGMYLRIDASALSPAIASYFAKVDHAHLTQRRPDGAERQLTIAVLIDQGTTRMRVALEPREMVAGLHVDIELLKANATLFRGQTSLNGALDSTMVVTVKPFPTSMVITPGTVTLGAIGDTATVTALLRFATGDPIPSAQLTFTIDDPRVAVVTPNGLLTAVANGSTYASATFGQVRGAATVRVQQVPFQWGLVEDSLVITVGTTARFTLTGKDRNGHPLLDSAAVTWSSSNTSVATVTATGTVQGVHTGLTQVTAKSGTMSATRPVRVVLGFPLPSAELAYPCSGLCFADLSGRTGQLPSVGCASAAWSPDHSLIACIDNEQLWLTSPLGQNRRQLVTGKATLPRYPEFSADGTWIYFAARTTLSDEIFRIHPDGSGLEEMTSAAGATAPTSAPDGTRFAFAALNGPLSGTTTNLVVQPIGGSPKVIATSVHPLSVHWSPDGQWIAYLVVADGQLWIVHPDGTGAHRLGTHGLFQGISWSPDGQWIVGMEAKTTLVNVTNGIMYDLDWSGGTNGVSWWR